MVEVMIGVVAAAVLGVVYGLLNRYAAARPKELCRGCALADVCEDRGSASDDGAGRPFDDREACYASHSGRESGDREP